MEMVESFMKNNKTVMMTTSFIDARENSFKKVAIIVQYYTYTYYVKGSAKFSLESMASIK